jgi:threonine/homoserine/homoserine lactone efflux protein
MSPDGIQSLILGITLLALAVLLYFAPTITAHRRRHPQREAIFATNFLLGWTFLGWCVALIWALTQPRQHTAS